jgi:parallel beta-helix repeat protein
MSKTYYVSANTGNDSNNGLSEKDAFKTLQEGVNRLQAGDTLLVMDGTYTQSDESKDLMLIENKNGSANNWINIKAYPGHKPKLKVKGSDAIEVVGSSYIRIEGLDLEGSKNDISLDYAKKEKDNWDNPRTNSYGIKINASYDRAGNETKSHHIDIINNKIRDFSGAGLWTFKTDYVTIKGNEVSGNSWYSPQGESGIHILYNWNSDNNTTDYKFIVEGNKVFDNQNLVEWTVAGKINEGHGIIIDDSLNTQNNSTGEPYKGKTLIANNIVYDNGGYGIQAYSSANVDIINNTTYQNSRNPDLSGEIVVLDSKNVRGYNNIMYARSDRRANMIWGSEDVTFDGNLAYNYKIYEFKASDDPNAKGLENILGKDPQFVDPSRGDFTLKSTSPAIDFGSGAFNSVTALKKDLQGNTRPQDGDGNGSAIADIGALEVVASNSSNNGEVKGVSNTSPIPKETNNDNLVTTSQTDKILTQEADNPLKSDVNADILTGESGADKFVYTDRNQQETFVQSTVNAADQITNFNPVKSDRIQSDLNGNLSTTEGAEGVILYSAGLVKGNNLSAAIQAAYKDKDPQTQGDQGLNNDESVLFNWQDKTYIAMNDQNKSFDPKTDLVLNVTGIETFAKDLVAGILQAKNYT